MRKLITILLCCSLQLAAQTPQRKVIMGLLAKPVAGGIIVDSILANGSIVSMGLQKGDLISELNGVKIGSMEDYGKIASTIRTGDKIEITFTRNQQLLHTSGSGIMKPYFQSGIADIKYDWVKFKNGYLRAMTYVPKNKNHVPAILLIPGYGCGSIENYPPSYNGRIINEWVKAGYAVVTIEKSGMGDSYGCAPCAEVDLVTDIESFDEGYKYMEALPFVDKTNLFIWGHSMGGSIAPEVAKKHSPKGVMVFACVFRPWSEFLLEMHRVQKPLMEGLNYQQTEDFVRKIQKIYYEFFVLKKSMEQLHAIPEYKTLVESELGYKKGSNDMWGRHWKFWQQLDSINLAESWKQTNCPVLVVFGGADYEQCSKVEPMMIRETVNEAHPGFATMVTIDNLDHFLMNSKDWKEAYQHFKNQEYNKGNFNPRIAEETVKWLASVSR